ncbi:MAG: type II secretion system F family protein [Spirochaetales bacterium]|nr:type II secretion system F family protein [Spirochaetales bacterium]
MAEYKCTGRDTSGKTLTITVKAGDRKEAFRTCAARDIDAWEIKEISRSSGKSAFPARVLPDFTDMMSMMLHSGLTLKDAIDISINPESRNDKLMSLLGYISDRMKSGESFPDILEGIGGPFSPFYIGMVRIGEKLGKLEEVFERLSSYIRDQKKLKDKLINAMIYPSVVLTMLIVGVFFLVFYLFPSLNETMSSITADGSGMNSNIASIEQGLYVIAAVFIVLIAFAVFYLVRGRKIPALRSFMQQTAMRFPVAGKIVKTRELMSFAFSMETLTESGYTVEAALEQSRQVINSMPLLENITMVQKELLRGTSLSQCFALAPLFPAIFERWTIIGEKTGNVSAVFSRLKTYYATELENSTSRIMGLIEPLIIIIVGIIMVLAIVTIVLPMLDLYSISL